MKVEIISIDPRKLVFLEKNARFMPHEMYERLVQNIKRDGALTSTPFCALLDHFEEGDEVLHDPEAGEPVLEVLSGNHRGRAAIDAGLEKIEVMATFEPMSKDKRIAFQLAHNAIDGQDDPAMLRELYASIASIDEKLYSGLDDKGLNLLQPVQPISISETGLSFQILSLMFLPNEIEEARKTLEMAKSLASGAEEVWAVRFEDYDKWLDSVEATGASYNIKNAATAIMLMLQIFRDNVTDLQDGWLNAETGEPKHNGWVPLLSIIGNDKMPATAAAIVNKAVQKMMDRGEITAKNKWQALEYLAANYLSE